MASRSRRLCGSAWLLVAASNGTAPTLPRHSLAYCLQVHIKACKGMASQAQIDLFLSLMKNRERKKKAVKRAHDLISDDIISSQGTVSDGIQQRKKSRVDSGGFASANSDLSRNAQDVRW